MILYKVLCLIRVWVVLWPQTGYIHPDEHFQGPEIVYGDVLQYDVYRPWEFVSSKPIRSIVFPYFISVIPAIIIKTLTIFHLKTNAYFLLILPRLFMCLMSFLQDLCIYKICVLLNLKYKTPLLFFASSYVTLVYLTRTFSNSLESLYFAILLLLLVRMLKLKDFMNDQSKSEVFLKRFTFLSFLYGIIFNFGFFNRPTFICFSTVPTVIVIYLFFNIRPKTYAFLAFMLGCLSSISYLTITDSFYYLNDLNNHLPDHIILTPLNFFEYNLNSDNLASHGLHPKWTHLFINIPLLFSIFGILLPLYSLKNSLTFIRECKPSFEILFLFSFFFPLGILSTIPHQEPRFIVSLIIPLCFLSAFHKFKGCSLFICTWMMTNLFCFSFYGFIHQAGVYSSIEHIRNDNLNNTLIIFHKTYMPPRYLLSITKEQNSNVIDFAGSSWGHIGFWVQSYNHPSYVYVIFPSNSVEDGSFNSELYELNYHPVKTVCIFPHFSTETLPELSDFELLIEKKLPFITKVSQVEKLFCILINVFMKN